MTSVTKAALDRIIKALEVKTAHGPRELDAMTTGELGRRKGLLEALLITRDELEKYLISNAEINEIE
jgi:hypothetical protein